MTGGAQKVSICLWFDNQAEDAAKFYTSLLPNSRIGAISRYGANQPMPEGTALTVAFELGNASFIALNGGPHFRFTEATSIVVKCDTQAEIDELWARLLENGGTEQQCFWLKDRFGLSWQIVPAQLEHWLSGDKLAAARVMSAVLASVKADIPNLQRAFDGN
jgi:predicted 3-demethylubiquinone-9 3-methyltransferase (glyoxalase superfamily)